MNAIADDVVPSFCWDRNLTIGQIRRDLREATGFEWVRLASWILREAPTGDVWLFLRPEEVQVNLRDLEPFLGRRREFWRYILGAWHELGRL